MDPLLAAKTVSVATTNFSIIHVFFRADFLVKIVILVLISASVYSWAIIIEKYKLFKKINISSSIFEDQFWTSKSADTLYKKLNSFDEDPMASVFKSGMDFMLKNKSKVHSMQDRIVHILNNSIDQEVEKIDKNLNYLATVGSVAPFVGLFGTVWGIMTSFQAIAIAKNTSLAVVAPGIAEALFATALGLLAAIPAVVAYNKFLSDSRKYSSRLENFTQSFISIM
jgi:biopolymer transport protein TolQ